MVKFLFSTIALFFCVNSFFATEIPIERAQAVAQNYVNQLKNIPHKRGESSVTVSYISVKSTLKRGANTNLFYIFNMNRDNGFVIVSAEDNVTPILGYSTESNFDINTISPQVKYWLSEYETQISQVITSKQTSLLAQQEWAKMESGIFSNKRGATAVKPLLKTSWDQSKYYNDSCPFDNTANKRTLTGCVATAMAQTMKYWGYPTKGTSSKSYTHTTYGTLSANFGNTTYNWGAMPNSVTGSNSEVERLMFHCGVALSMNYGTTSSSAFNSYDSYYQEYPSTHFALQDYFGYDGTSITSVYKKNFTDQAWIAKMKNEIDQGKVVIYEGNDGQPSGSGHCFVLDGYDANSYFHINWGWSGNYNGYFTFANLVPNGTGSGGGRGNYTSNQGAVIGIIPKANALPVVDFNVNTTTTTVGDVIILTDLSTNYPSSWNWSISPNNATFVNGTVNTSKNPELKFSTPGKYSVSLTATNSKGSGSITKTAYIIVNPQLASQVCDTLTNFLSTEQKRYIPITGGGSLAGHISGLKGFAESYTNYGSYTHISGALLDFARAETNNNTSTIKVNVYQNNNGLPGSVLATKSVKIVDIRTDISNGSQTKVVFDSPIAITGQFFIGFETTNAPGDSVGLFTTSTSGVTTNTAFIQFPSDNSWCSYVNCWSSLKIHLKVSPLVSILPTANFVINSSPTLTNTNIDIDASTSTNVYAYNWTLNGASISSSQLYKETISYASPNTYNIKLDVIGGCGNTSTITKQVVVNSSCSAPPATPGSITGNAYLCVNQSNITYSVASVAGAASYVWTLPSGLSGSSSTNSITVSASSSPISGNIQVQAVNSCGTSQASSLSITTNPILTPTFNQVSPICSGGSLLPLPTNSINNVNGTWSPALDNTKTTTYTFTPNQGQCANTSSMMITVNPIVTPSFTSVNPICTGASLAALQTTSNNNITGTWSPALDNTKTTTYTFTPTQGQCSNTTSMIITVKPIVTPSFNSVNAICSGASLAALPTTSINSISGSWSPALDNSKTTTYTFTPTQGQCANSTSMIITVNPVVTPSFNAVNAICSGTSLTALPTTSNNSISGSWSPALDNKNTTTYTFTPTQGQCATTNTLIITVNPTLTPTFAVVSPICVGGILSPLPTTSLNNVTGTWLPALDNTTTTTYTFTPTPDICATSTNLKITVNSSPITPTFNINDSICEGDNIAVLPISSNENVTGTWSPAIDNTKTTTYTFTPDQNQCSNQTTVKIVVNKIPDAGSILNLKDVCIGKSLNVGTTVVGGVWTSSNPKIATIDNKGLVTGLDSGLVQIVYTRTLNHCKDSATASLKINNCASLDMLNKNEQISIYPNPTNNTLNLNLKGQKFEEYSIVDALGKVLIVGKITQDLQTINVSSLASGSYFLRVYSNENQLNYIFEKE